MVKNSYICYLLPNQTQFSQNPIQQWKLKKLNIQNYLFSIAHLENVSHGNIVDFVGFIDFMKWNNILIKRTKYTDTLFPTKCVYVYKIIFN